MRIVALRTHRAAKLIYKRVQNLHAETRRLSEIEPIRQAIAFIAYTKLVVVAEDLIAHRNCTRAVLCSIRNKLVDHQSDGLDTVGRDLTFIPFNFDWALQDPR